MVLAETRSMAKNKETLRGTCSYPPTCTKVLQCFKHLHEKATQVCMIIRAKSELFSSEIRLPTFTEP